jgi:hypothetical protein
VYKRQLLPSQNQEAKQVHGGQLIFYREAT